MWTLSYKIKFKKVYDVIYRNMPTDMFNIAFICKSLYQGLYFYVCLLWHTRPYWHARLWAWLYWLLTTYKYHSHSSLLGGHCYSRGNCKWQRIGIILIFGNFLLLFSSAKHNFPKQYLMFLFNLTLVQFWCNSWIEI